MKKFGAILLVSALCIVFASSAYAQGLRLGGVVGLPSEFLWLGGIKVGPFGVYGTFSWTQFSLINPEVVLAGSSTSLDLELTSHSFVVGPLITFDLVRRPYGNLYFGASGNYITFNNEVSFDYSGQTSAKLKGTAFEINPLMGAEMWFNELPELVFFFQFGFGILIINDIEAIIDGVTTTIKPHTQSWRTPTARIGIAWRFGVKR